MIIPKFYHYRNKNESDLKWIQSRMQHIPENRQKEVAEQYERLYMTNRSTVGRKNANTYLNGIAMEYRTPKNQAQS